MSVKIDRVFDLWFYGDVKGMIFNNMLIKYEIYKENLIFIVFLNFR